MPINKLTMTTGRRRFLALALAGLCTFAGSLAHADQRTFPGANGYMAFSLGNGGGNQVLIFWNPATKQGATFGSGV